MEAWASTEDFLRLRRAVTKLNWEAGKLQVSNRYEPNNNIWRGCIVFFKGIKLLQFARLTMKGNGEGRPARFHKQKIKPHHQPSCDMWAQPQLQGPRHPTDL